MTEQQIATAVDELIELTTAGRSMEAIEKYYHDDIEKTDLDGITHQGKAANEEQARILLSKVVAVRDFTPVGKMVKGNRSFVVWSLDFDHADNGIVKIVEVGIQDWQDGKIIRERYIA